MAFTTIDGRLRLLEVTGCVLGLAGAFLLAANCEISRYGWLLFLAANVAVVGFAHGIKARWLLLQQFGFTLSSCLGVYRAFGLHL